MKTLNELMDAWEDGSLSPEELLQLKTLLRNPENRSQMRDEVCFFGLLNDVLSDPRTHVQLESDKQIPARALAARLLFFITQWIPEAFRAQPALAWGSIAFVLFVCLFIWLERPRPVAYVSQSGDGVLITHSGKNSQARPDSKIFAGDSLTAPQFASAAFRWRGEQTEFYLSPGTKIQVSQKPQGKQLSLSNGVLKAVVARQPQKLPLIVNSPAALTKVIGTRFTLRASGKGDRLEVVDGTVEFTRIQQQQTMILHGGDSALAAPDVPFEVKTIDGAVWWEVWVAGATALSNDIPQPSTMVYEDYLGGLYTLVWSYPFISDWSKHYHERARGFIIPEQTGDYTFWMMSRNASELWLSKDSSPSNKVIIASSPPPPPGTRLTQTWNWVLQPGTDQTATRNVPWNKFPSQKSARQRLIAGRRYYFEALHELVFEDCIAVVWSKPNDDFPAETVPGRVLSPFRK